MAPQEPPTTTNRTELRTLSVPFCFSVFVPNLLLALCFSSLYQVLIPFRTLWLLSEKGMSYFQVPQNPDCDTLVRHDQLSVRKQFFFLMLSSHLLILRNEVLSYSEVYSTDLGFKLKIWDSVVKNFSFRSCIQRRLLNVSLLPRDK